MLMVLIDNYNTSLVDENILLRPDLCLIWLPVKQVAPMNFGPPLIRHVIRGTHLADVPVSGVEVLMHRQVQLKQWRLCKAADLYWRCYWPVSAGGELVFDGKTHPLVPGWLYLIAPHTSFDSSCARPFQKWYIHFTVSGLGHPCGPGIIRIRPTARMRRLLTLTCPAANGAGASSSAPKEIATIELIALALESALQKKPALPNTNQRIAGCIDFMRHRLTEKLTLKSLARFAGASPRKLTQMFVAATGFPPNRYLIEMRLNHAMRLLRHTNESIDQIAEDAGFGNRYYFTRMFTKYRYITPVSFRKFR